MTVVCDGGAGAQAGVRHRDGSKTCRSNRAPGNTRRGLISCLSAAPLITPGISLNPRLCSLMVRKWSTVPISLSYTTPGISTRENTCSPTLCALPVNACTCVRTASHLWSDGSPGLTVRVFQRAGDILMVPGAGLQPQPDVSCRMGRRHCPSCDRVDGADGVLTQQAATGSPIQFRAPTQRVEGRECVPHDCGAVRMYVCVPGIRAGGAYRETLWQTRLLRSILRLPGDRGSHQPQYGPIPQPQSSDCCGSTWPVQRVVACPLELVLGGSGCLRLVFCVRNGQVQARVLAPSVP
jgi:hypothetical protein